MAASNEAGVLLFPFFVAIIFVLNVCEPIVKHSFAGAVQWLFAFWAPSERNYCVVAIKRESAESCAFLREAAIIKGDRGFEQPETKKASVFKEDA
jgi:hypothetical protein